MTPVEYLLYSIQHRCYTKSAWIVAAFAITRETEKQKTVFYPGKLSREPYGLFCYLENGELVKIDAPLDQPLFRKEDRIVITPEWISSLKEPKLETSVGTLLVNLVCIHYAFGAKFPYKAGKFRVRQVEKEIIPKLKSVPALSEKRSDEHYYTDEYLKFHEGVGFLETHSHLFTHSVTKHTLLPAPGRKAFKAELLKQYEGKLHDPVEMAKFEKALEAFDNEYLKKDPSYGKHISGKVHKSRMKSFMTQGGEGNSFIDSMEITPILQSLDEGIPLDEEGFTAIGNNIRYGSFSRGVETVNGGVVAKAIGRATESWVISGDDCGTTMGIMRRYSETDIDQLVGRSVIENNQPKHIETLEDAKKYLLRTVFVRSPAYCSRPGDQTCKVCAGAVLSKYPTGLPIPLMGLSGGILNDSLKKMHNSALTTATLDLKSALI